MDGCDIRQKEGGPDQIRLDAICSARYEKNLFPYIFTANTKTRISKGLWYS